LTINKYYFYKDLKLYLSELWGSKRNSKEESIKNLPIFS
jgi:hypothetical protein